MTTTDRASLADGLSDQDREVLAIEGRTFRHRGFKERVIRERTGLSPFAYFVHLNGLIDRPAALRHAPAVVNRLRARRTSARGDEHEEGGDGDGEVRILRGSDRPPHG